MYFGVVTLLIKYSFHAPVSLSCVQRLWKMKLVRTLLHIQLKQTNLENKLHISIEILKECFNDTVSQHFVNELKHCN